MVLISLVIKQISNLQSVSLRANKNTQFELELSYLFQKEEFVRMRILIFTSLTI